jgi:hypothetical protein
MSLTIADLPDSRELDRRAMTAIRGGKFDPAQIVINPQVSVSQNTNVSQLFDIHILNGADLSGTKGFDFNFAFAPVAAPANTVKLPAVPFV